MLVHVLKVKSPTNLHKNLTHSTKYQYYFLLNTAIIVLTASATRSIGDVISRIHSQSLAESGETLKSGPAKVTIRI